MTAIVRHMPPPWFRVKRFRASRPTGGPGSVMCIHHNFQRVQLGDGVEGLIMFECRGCGRLVWWEREARAWHEETGVQVPYVELTEDMVIQEGHGQQQD